MYMIISSLFFIYTLTWFCIAISNLKIYLTGNLTENVYCMLLLYSSLRNFGMRISLLSLPEIQLFSCFITLIYVIDSQVNCTNILVYL